MSWESVTLSEATHIISGGTPKSGVAEYWEGDIEWITPKDMGKMSGIYASNTGRKITELGLSKSSAKLIAQNSVILSTRAPIGHLAINTVPMATNQGCRGLVPKDNLDTKYLYYFLSKSVDLLNDLGSGTTFKELSKGSLEKITIPLPTLLEQKRIVSILDQAFADLEQVRAKTEQNLKNARELFDSYLEQVFSQKGEGWVESTLGSVCTFQGGSQPPKSVFTKKKNEGNVRLIQIRDYKSDSHIVYIPKDKAKRFCSTDDVMIGRYGPPLFQILRGIEGAYNVALLKAIPNKSILSKDYLFYFLKNKKILRYIINASNRAAGQIGLNKPTLERYPIIYPSLNTQRDLIISIERLEKATEALENLYQQKLTDLDELKKSILQKAFSGELTAKAE